MASRLSGPPEVPAPFSSLVDALRSAAELQRPWLTFHLGAREEVLDAAGALELARRWARALADAGARSGDRVLVLMPNAAPFVGAFFGAQLLGATPVPVAWPYAPTTNAVKLGESLAHLLRAAAPRVVAT
ncbi:AMP-binding protein, partial [Myxococcota bacterium]|nr:AMP-binding protein [Myxococcota bacterium]